MISLELGFNNISLLPDGIFDTLSSLRFLNLQSNNLKQFNFDIVRKSIGITEIKLSYNKIQKLGGNIGIYASLNSVILSNNMLTNLDIQGINKFIDKEGFMDLTKNKNKIVFNCNFDYLFKNKGKKKYKIKIDNKNFIWRFSDGDDQELVSDMDSRCIFYGYNHKHCEEYKRQFAMNYERCSYGIYIYTSLFYPALPGIYI